MGLFHDRMLGPEMVAALNQLYAAFAASAYPPGGGMFPPGTLAAPSVRGTADPATGWNFVDGEAQLSVGGLLKARATAAGFLDAAGNPLLSAANAVGDLSTGSIIERGSSANGEYTKFGNGIFLVRHTFTLLAGESDKEWDLPVSSYGNASLHLLPVFSNALPTFKYAAKYGDYGGSHADFVYSASEDVFVIAQAIGYFS